MRAPAHHIDFDVEDEEMQIDTGSGSNMTFTREEVAEAVRSCNFNKDWVPIVLMAECCIATSNSKTK